MSRGIFVNLSDPQDYGFMYWHGFQDPDGHGWELVYMAPSALEGWVIQKLVTTMTNPKVSTCLWYDSQAEEAARFYVSLFDNSEITHVMRRAPEETPLLVTFTLAGTPYQALNGGSIFMLSEAASISVSTRDQAETDRLWTALTTDGGAESKCGWLRDRFGLSWQIVPEALPHMLNASDREAAQRAMSAMMEMHKIDVAALEAAFNAMTRSRVATGRTP